MIRKTLRLLFWGAWALALSSCSDAEVGSKERPFTMYFVPYIEADTIAKTAEKFSRYVEREMSQRLYGKNQGFYVASAVPTSYVAVVEALGSKKADFAALNTYSYILAKDIKKYDVQALFTVILHGGMSRYKGQFIARVGSGINTLQDIQGKKLAYSDPASTSGFVMPSQMLRDLKVTPSEVVFAGKHDNVVTMVYQGQVDVGATYYVPPRERVEDGKKQTYYRDARNRVKPQFPDVFEKVKIIGHTRESPNGPWVIRTQLYSESEKNKKIGALLKQVIFNFTKSTEGSRHLKANYDIDGVVPAHHQDYEWIRKAIVKVPKTKGPRSSQ